ncbi:MAG: glycoside hydrolase family 127 protein, partial [Anaerolineae bacterium]|nr:glycoside hydrolase family 127 protein [Anaerolineae bacterium]
EIEMALVELYRATGEQRYLKLSQFFIDQRGSGKMRGYRSYGPEYHQDRLPVRQAVQVEGHAVRQLYLLSGITDLYLETGEQALLDAAERLWRDAFTHKMFITGGFGTRFEAENFGEPYELPSDSCYCETCAAIASAMWNWRMLLATGEARFADQLEHVLYNGFLSGLSHDGCHYFYVNPLQSRTGIVREDWYEVACCPPNIMRQIASIGQYAATQTDAGIQIHQYMGCALRTTLPAGDCALRIETDYPWQGRVRLTVQETGDDAWSLSLRLPGWCAAPEISINDQPMSGLVPGDYAVLNRKWAPGDVILLSLPMMPRWLQPHPRIDAIRGSVAVENGPLVYCLEDIDQPAGVHLLDVRANTSQTPRVVWRDDVLDGLNMMEVPGVLSEPDAKSDALYRPLSVIEAMGAPLTLTAIPYYAWANRGSSAMRVWIPRA